MQTFELNSASAGYAVDYFADHIPDIVNFTPTADDILPCRAEYRAALLEAVRKSIPVTAAAEYSAGWLGSEEKRDALCELLSCVGFLFTDTGLAEFIGITGKPADSGEGHDDNTDYDGDNEECGEKILRELCTRFGFDSAVLTDLGLAFDGEKITLFPAI